MATLGEHEYQAPNHLTNATDQSPAAEDVVKKVNKLLSQSKKYRKRYDQDWWSNYEFVMCGKQWDQMRPKWRFSEVINLTWSTLEMEIAIQTDARPKFEYTMQEFSDETFTKALKDVNQRNWDRYKWSQCVQDLLTDCKLYHVAHGAIRWNPDLEMGLGDVEMIALNPFYCYWDPIAQDVNTGKRCRYFIYAEPVPTSQLKKDYPKFAEQLKSDVSDYQKEGKSGFGEMVDASNVYDRSTPSRMPISKDGNGETYGGEKQTVLIKCWLRDDTLEQCEEEHEDGSKEYVLKQKYPMGRYIEVANNLCLRDGPPGVDVNGEWVPYEFDLFPVFRLVNYQYPREYAGENEITHIRGTQKILNNVWSYILDSFKMAANPVKIVSTQSDIDVEKLTNEPGLIIETADMGGYRQEPGVPIASGAFELLNTARSFFNDIQGLQDISRGAEQAGANSGVMLEGYLEAAQTRPRMKNRALDMALQDMGQIMLRFYLQFYTQQRVFRITNQDGYPEFIEFMIATDENGKKIAKIRRKSTKDGITYDMGQEVNVEIKGVPDVRVTSGSALPYAKAQRAQTALTYFTSGAIDQEELLKEVDWPNAQNVVQRMKQAAQEAAQAQLAAGAPQ